MFDEFALPITTTASASRAIVSSAAWRFVVAKQRSLRDAVQSDGTCSRVRSSRPCHSVCESVVCASIATSVSASMIAQRVVERGLAVDEADRVGRDRDRADRFVVAGVADVEDAVALLRRAPSPRGAPS